MILEVKRIGSLNVGHLQVNKDIAEDCLGVELNGRSLEFVNEFCRLGDRVGARGYAVYRVITRIKSE